MLQYSGQCVRKPVTFMTFKYDGLQITCVESIHQSQGAVRRHQRSMVREMPYSKGSGCMCLIERRFVPGVTLLRRDIFMANSGKVAKKLLVRSSSSNLERFTIDPGSSLRQLMSNLSIARRCFEHLFCGTPSTGWCHGSRLEPFMSARQ